MNRPKNKGLYEWLSETEMEELKAQLESARKTAKKAIDRQTIAHLNCENHQLRAENLFLLMKIKKLMQWMTRKYGVTHFMDSDE